MNIEKTTPVIVVLYTCCSEHITQITYHAQAIQSFPHSINCSTCFKEAKYAAVTGVTTKERIADPKKLSVDFKENNRNDEFDLEDDDDFSSSHLEALHSRRTIKELERNLQEHLEMYRHSKNH